MKGRWGPRLQGPLVRDVQVLTSDDTLRLRFAPGVSDQGTLVDVGPRHPSLFEPL